MQTVIETQIYERAAREADLSQQEREEIVQLLAENPMLGHVIQGTSGCRKFRFSRQGGGKSGGYRIISYYAGENVPIFLMDIFAKNQKINISAADKSMLKMILTTMVTDYRKGTYLKRSIH